MINNIMELVKQIPTPHPEIRATYERIAKIPRIAEYQKTKKDRPF